MSKDKLGASASRPGSSSLRSPEPPAASRPLRGDDPSRNRLPLVVRLVIRTALFAVAFVAIGLASGIAEHFLVDAPHGSFLTTEDLAVYRGGLSTLLILWFFGLLRCDSDRSGEAGETALAGSTEGESAGRDSGIAQTTAPESHP